MKENHLEYVHAKYGATFVNAIIRGTIFVINFPPERDFEYQLRERISVGLNGWHPNLIPSRLIKAQNIKQMVWAKETTLEEIIPIALQWDSVWRD